MLSVQTERLRDEHLNNQFIAADPRRSVWVSANAGSGKTRVLTDRIIRLMLDGAPPGKILCVTFTKAAAAEMSERLYKRLGEWIVKSDEELTVELRTLTRAEPDSVQIGKARRLFARVLETPGGLKIQTVHGFCEGLLKRFPSEAGVSSAFELIEESQQKQLMKQALDEIFSEAAKDSQSALAAALIQMSQFSAKDKLIDILNDRSVRKILKNKGLSAFFAKAESKEGEESKKEIVFAEYYFQNLDPNFLRDLVEIIKTVGSPSEQNKTETLLKIIAFVVDKNQNNDAAILAALKEIFYTKEGDFRKNPFTKKVYEKADHTLEKFVEDFKRYVIFQEKKRIRELTEKFGVASAAFHAAYERKKNADSYLDYDDLIEKTADLLDTSEKSAWALYKLDGGIDHVLIDEAQDTSPEQWRIIENLTADFFTGKSARNTGRTVFAVGDEKQSVYGFNGADPACMSQSLTRFRMREEITIAALKGSFRSAPAILKITDAVFQSDRCLQSVSFGEYSQKTEHYAVENPGPGKVTLYPCFHAPEKIERDWNAPVDAHAENSAQARMAKFIASEIKGLLQSDSVLPSKGKKTEPGDILILLRKRGGFANLMRRALKNENLPTAGADRMVLMKEQAVLDLTALIEFTLLPEDDLNLACLLRSPLCGFSEEDLFELCHDRGEVSVYRALRKKIGEGGALYEKTDAFLSRCLRMADFETPYDFLTRILEKERGREKFIRNMGRACLDPIDELLNCALSFARGSAPSLQNFMAFLRGGSREIKRESAERGSEIRVMTVHGAKGLEAPLVFIPDTVVRSESKTRHYIEESETGDAVWIRGHTILKETEPFQSAIKTRKDKEDKEYYRLLYVALTRAKDQLFITGLRPAGKAEQAEKSENKGSEKKFLNWYDTVKDVMIDLPQTREESFELNASETVYIFEDPARDETVTETVKRFEDLQEHNIVQSVAERLPDFIARPVFADHEPEAVVSKITPSTAGAKQTEPYSVAAVLRGERIHKLLELLPKVKAELRESSGVNFLTRSGVSFDTAQELTREAVGVIEHPECAQLFGENSYSEVTISGRLKNMNGEIISARPDRLAIVGGCVYVADFKSGKEILNKNEISDEYLLQAGLYYSALRDLYPEKTIKFFIVATNLPKVFALDSEVLEKRAARFTDARKTA